MGDLWLGCGTKGEPGTKWLMGAWELPPCLPSKPHRRVELGFPAEPGTSLWRGCQESEGLGHAALHGQLECDLSLGSNMGLTYIHKP